MPQRDDNVSGRSLRTPHRMIRSVDDEVKYALADMVCDLRGGECPRGVFFGAGDEPSFCDWTQPGDPGELGCSIPDPSECWMRFVEEDVERSRR